MKAARRASLIAVLPLIGRRAARDFAADDPVFGGITGHRPSGMRIEGLLVAPLLDQKDMLVVVLWQHQIKLNAAVIAARALRMPAHQIEELTAMLSFYLKIDDDHDLTHRRSLSARLWGIIAPSAAPRQAREPKPAGDPTMAYDALRTIMPIAG